MRKSINYYHKRQYGVTITEVDNNVNGHWTRKKKNSEVEVGIMEINRKRFILKYGTPLMDVGTLHKYLVTPEETISSEKVLP